MCAFISESSRIDHIPKVQDHHVVEAVKTCAAEVMDCLHIPAGNTVITMPGQLNETEVLHVPDSESSGSRSHTTEVLHVPVSESSGSRSHTTEVLLVPVSESSGSRSHTTEVLLVPVSESSGSRSHTTSARPSSNRCRED